MGCCLQISATSDSQQNISKENPNNSQQKSKKKLYANRLQLQNSQKHQPSIQQLKKEGNNCFHKKDYRMAILCYRKGLLLPNNDASFYTNLALSYKMNRQYQESINAIQEMNLVRQLRNHKNSQFYRKGQIIKSRCIIILVKQYCLEGNYTRIQNQSKLKQIGSAIVILEDILLSPNTQNELKGYLQSGHLVKRFLIELIVPHSKAQALQVYLTNKLSSIKEEGQIFKYYPSHKHILAQIKNMVKEQKQQALQDQKDYLVDPITYQIFINPFIVPSGQSYDQNMLKQHFTANGYKDPITKQMFPLGVKVIIKNNNLKAHIDERKSKITKQDIQMINI